MAALRSKQSPKKSWKEGITSSPLLWLLPLTIILLATFIYPIFEIVRLSFTNAGLVGEDYSYTLESYTDFMTSPYFFNILTVTVIFVFFSVLFQLLLGFLIASIVDQGAKRGMRTSTITRTAVLTAWAIPGVLIGIIWGILYEQSGAGILNYIFGVAGIGPVPFVSDPEVALASVTVANVWRGTAFAMILVYAGLQTLPTDVIDAARIDGANAWQRLTRVVVPLLTPILLITLVFLSIQTFNTFDMVLALTGGGPGRSTEVIALSVYDQIFQQFNLGAGAATAVLLLAVNVIMTVVYLRMLQRDGEEIA